MVTFVSRFEGLPNELLSDIMAYLDVREVFKSFYELNTRFKKLLLSTDNLQFTISLFDPTEKQNYEIFFMCIRTLIINRGSSLSLKHFKKLRCLILHNPQGKLFEQLDNDIIPYIVHLSITHKFLISSIQTLTNDLHEKIFSNHFPYLKSCHLSDMEVIHPIKSWQQSHSLNIVKVGQITLPVYKSILLACPNLYLLQVKKLSWAESTSNMISHSNLKQLIIQDDDQPFPWNNSFISEYLLSVPNLEKLTIHRQNFFKKIREYLNYDWLASIIIRSLHFLREFNFILHVYGTKIITKCLRESTFCALKEHFINQHKYQYNAAIKFIEE